MGRVFTIRVRTADLDPTEGAEITLELLRDEVDDGFQPRPFHGELTAALAPLTLSSDEQYYEAEFRGLFIDRAGDFRIRASGDGFLAAESEDFTLDCEDSAANDGFYFGSGTASAPYAICSPDQLTRVSDHLSSHFILARDIIFDQSGSTGTFTPIGQLIGADEVQPFTGHLDGRSHTIRNRGIQPLRLTYRSRYVGLFAINGGTIEDLHLENVALVPDLGSATTIAVGSLAGRNSGTIRDVTAHVVFEVSHNRAAVGGLVGENWNNIETASVTGSITGSRYLGGLVGSTSAGSISASHAEVEITGDSEFSRRMGGLIGSCVDTEVSDSTALAQIIATSPGPNEPAACGGLVGRSYCIIKDSHSSGEVNCPAISGGLVGFQLQAQGSSMTSVVERSSSSANVTAPAHPGGGLVGRLESSTIRESFSTGDVSAAYAGGLAGFVPVGDPDADPPQDFARIEDSYTLSRVASSEAGSNCAAGGLVGRNGGILTRSYIFITADADIPQSPVGCVNTGPLVGSVITGSAGNPTRSYYGTAAAFEDGPDYLSAQEFGDADSFTTWPFDSTWAPPTGTPPRPRLAWEDLAGE